MNDRQNFRDKTEQQLIDSLLKSALGNASVEAQTIVTRTLRRLEELPGQKAKAAADQSCVAANTASINQTVMPKSNHDSRRWLSRHAFLTFVTASVVLIAIALPFISIGESAIRIIQRSLEISKQNVPRHYSLVTEYQGSNDQTYHREGDLYVKGNDQFAIRKTGLGGRELWIGGHGENSWVVPAVGPVIEGDQLGLVKWLDRKKELATPYLHVSSILQRMGTGYKLTNHNNVIVITNNGPVDCRHIEGRLRQMVDRRDTAERVPDRIELWASVDTGVAVKVVASWDLASGQSGRKSITVELLGEPDLPDDWFHANGHYEGNRRRITFNSDQSN